jgi:sugar lactone lactonase YvrE
MRIIHTCSLLIVALASAVACGSSDSKSDTIDALELPGDHYYPESISATADGTLFVSSVGTGQVVRFAPGSSTAEVFIDGGNPPNASGVFADSNSSTLYLCAFLDLTQMPPPNEVRAYDLRTGALKTKYGFPGPSFCNDFALDGAGNVFVTDSLGKVYELAKDSTTLTVWSADPLLAPSSPTGVGADGIALDGKGNLYVNTFDSGRVVRIPIQEDGTAGAAVEISLPQPLQSPDGMRLLDPNTLILVEGAAGRLTRVAISGDTATTTAIAEGLSGPTSVAAVDTSYWVTEGQLGHFLGTAPGSPSLPFLIKRVAFQ